MSKEAAWMRRALQLAEKGRGWTLPNPMVGAVLVKNGKVIGEGYHTKYGTKHAEVEALDNCKENSKGSTLYVNLEPCCHTGNTPPCTEALIRSGITNVVIASKDPSKKINGKGTRKLRSAGIKVQLGLLQKESEELNRAFYTFHRKKRPFIVLKAAMSLDGKIALKRGLKTQLSGGESQKYAHRLRHENQAILVGAGTLLSDNPHLGVRYVNGRDPLRLILQGKRKLSRKAQIFRNKNVVVLKQKTISNILKKLYKMGIVSILVEGGHEVFNHFLNAGVVDEIQLIVSPIMLGAKALPLASFKRPIKLTRKSSKKMGEDTLLVLEPQY